MASEFSTLVGFSFVSHVSEPARKFAKRIRTRASLDYDENIIEFDTDVLSTHSRDLFTEASILP